MRGDARREQKPAAINVSAASDAGELRRRDRHDRRADHRGDAAGRPDRDPPAGAEQAVDRPAPAIAVIRPAADVACASRAYASACAANTAHNVTPAITSPGRFDAWVAPPAFSRQWTCAARRRT